MEKTILVVKRFQYSTKTPTYNIEKSAKTLEEAMKYKIALFSCIYLLDCFDIKLSKFIK